MELLAIAVYSSEPLGYSGYSNAVLEEVIRDSFVLVQALGCPGVR